MKLFFLHFLVTQIIIQFMKILSNRRGRVFYRYILSYLIILLIPVLLSFAFFEKSRDILNDETQRANELLLGQMTSYLDMILSDTIQLTKLINYNQKLEGLLYESLPLDSNDKYSLYQLSSDFNMYYRANKNILDFYVYIPGIDRVITPWGSHKSKKYLTNWIPELNINNQEWLGQFSHGIGTSYSETKTVIQDERPQESISIISSMERVIMLDKPVGWVVIHLDKEYFRNIFNNTRWTEKTILVVYHEDSGIVTSSDPSIELSHLSSLDFDDIQNGINAVSINGTDYISQYIQSEVENKIKFISLVPKNIYRERFLSLTRFAVILLLSSFMFGSYLIYRFSVARYKPVKKLLALLSPSEGESISIQSDEFSLIAQSMEMTINEDKRLKEDQIKSDTILSQRYMKQLFNGVFKYDEKAKETLSSYGINFDKPYNTLILLDIELDEEAETDVRDHFIQNMWFQEQRPSLYTIQDLDGAVGFLINHNEDDFDNLVNTIGQQKIEAESQLPLFLAIGISNAHREDEDLSVIYTEALAALDFRLVRGRQLPIKFRDVKTSSRSYYYPINVEIKMMNYIKSGDRNGATDVLNEVYVHNFSKDLPNLEIAQCLMFDLISTMIKTLNNIPTLEVDTIFWENVKPITILMNCRSFDQLRVEMGEILERVCDYVIAGKPNKNDVLLNEIIQFIEKNYRDKNLSPELIASFLNRNKAYLCRFFRDHKGLGISSFIKQHRVKIAKELMIGEHISVVDVADKVGFSGSNSFIRAYKELEGITPGQYLSSLFN